MTTEQRERLLGQLCEGVSTDAACEALGLTWLDVSMRLDSDPSFRLSYYLAQSVRDTFTEKLEELTRRE